MTFTASLKKPFTDWQELKPLANLPRKMLALEVSIVLLLSLGKSGVYALLSLVSYITRPERSFKTINNQKVSMTNVFSERRPWLDFLYHFADFFFSLMPVLLVIYLLWHSKDSIRALWFNKGKYFEPKDALKAFAILATVGLIGLGFYLVSNLLGFAATISAGDNEGSIRYFLFLTLDALEAALLEEIIVLGYVLVRLRQLGVRLSYSLALAAVLRGSYHLYQGLWGFVGNFFMGLIFGYLYARWGRLTPLIIAHFLFDFVAFVGLFLLAGHLDWIPTK